MSVAGNRLYRELRKALAGLLERWRRPPPALLSECSDGEFILGVAEILSPRQGARPREIEVGKAYLRESPQARQTLLQGALRAHFETQREQKPDVCNPLYCHIPGTDIILTPELWDERSRQLEKTPPRSSSCQIKALPRDFRHSGEYLVSAIASLYKGGNYIRRFLDNITSQTLFDRSELIIIDADSPDGEREVIEEYRRRYPNIVYERINFRIGIYQAWNLGVRLSRGKYLTNVNLDDLRRADSFEIQASTLDRHQFASVVYQDFFTSFDARLGFEEVARYGFKTNLPIVTPHNLLHYNSPHNAPMWRKELHGEMGLFDESLISAGDWEFWLRCCAGKKRFFKINTPHVVYFQNPEGVSTRPDTAGLREGRVVYRRYSRKLLQPHLLMSRAQFARSLGIEPEWSWDDSYYDVAHRQMAELGRRRREHSAL